MAWLCTSCSVAIVSAPCLLQYCWVHPEKEAAIQCILCLRCKVRQRLGGAAPCSVVADRLDGTADKQAGRHARRSCSRRRGATAGAGRVPSPLQLLSLRLSGPAVSSLSHHQDPLGVFFARWTSRRATTAPPSAYASTGLSTATSTSRAAKTVRAGAVQGAMQGVDLEQLV